MTNAGTDMSQTFDWIFFAIVLLPTAALVWDWLRERKPTDKR